MIRYYLLCYSYFPCKTRATFFSAFKNFPITLSPYVILTLFSGLHLKRDKNVYPFMHTVQRPIKSLCFNQSDVYECIQNQLLKPLTTYQLDQ